MGTRSITKVMMDNKVLVCIYRQLDGYPEGMGADLVDFCKDRTIVNGFGTNTPAKANNGIDCFAASLIGYLKKDQIGGIYICFADTTANECDAEYEYTISQSNDKLKVVCRDIYGKKTKVLYDGNAESKEKVTNIKEIVQFHYSKDGVNTTQRKVGVIEEDKKYIRGLDMDDDNRIKCFAKSKIVNGAIWRKPSDESDWD